jgi:DNA polymerase/3'-5' exonuclease PolX
MGKNKTTCLIKYGYKGKERIRQLDMVLIEKDEYPWYILYFGSGRDFSKKIRGIASNKGYRLNEKGLYNKKTGERIDFSPKSERDIFDFLEIPFIRPELR